MARTHVITGSASGIGKATAARLTGKGHKVIGVDLHSADIIADLATKEGRAKMIAEVARLAPDGIDGILAGAGISDAARPADTIAINYFGAKETLEGLRPQLRGPRPRAVTICSTSVVMPFDQMTLELCLAGDEEAAKKHAAEIGGFLYGCTKRALWLWLRHAALKKEWAGSGIMLNAVAPGAIMTPMTAPLLDIPEMRELLKKSNPVAVDKYAPPEDVAEFLDFLLNFEGNYILGQSFFIDGGTDAIIRPDHV
jgi:NAD(P)-dependent dehydrogenase (short-subunit alcohol dehydrogenase family)